MNKERREQIQEIINRLDAIELDIGSIKDDEQCAFDNLPEGIQTSERGDSMEAAIDALEEAENTVEDIRVNLIAAME